ncbi:MAG: UTP--glucose-1-phosphate uridylyltransferase GalU [Pseudomonadota bacterium]
MSSAITKAVFPVAGLGTRFLPATKANPKEMLPVVDKPLIQYAAEEAVRAGAKELVFVTGRSKRAIEDHFDKAVELEAELEERGKAELLQMVRSILPGDVSCVYIRQAEPLGLGHAVLCARPVVGNSPFAVMLADDLIADDGQGCLSQMAKVFAERGNSVLALQRVAPSDTDKYGVVDVGADGTSPHRIQGIVEKPAPADAPSNLGVVGRYILTPRIMDLLARTGRGAGGEIQLTDAISDLLGYEHVLGLEFEGRRYDCGDKLGYLEATVELGLAHPQLGAGFKEFLERRLQS